MLGILIFFHVFDCSFADCLPELQDISADLLALYRCYEESDIELARLIYQADRMACIHVHATKTLQDLTRE